MVKRKKLPPCKGPWSKDLKCWPNNKRYGKRKIAYEQGQVGDYLVSLNASINNCSKCGVLTNLNNLCEYCSK